MSCRSMGSKILASDRARCGWSGGYQSVASLVSSRVSQVFAALEVLSMPNTHSLTLSQVSVRDLSRRGRWSLT